MEKHQLKHQTLIILLSEVIRASILKRNEGPCRCSPSGGCCLRHLCGTRHVEPVWGKFHYIMSTGWYSINYVSHATIYKLCDW